MPDYTVRPSMPQPPAATVRPGASQPGVGGLPANTYGDVMKQPWESSPVPAPGPATQGIAVGEPNPSAPQGSPVVTHQGPGTGMAPPALDPRHRAAGGFAQRFRQQGRPLFGGFSMDNLPAGVKAIIDARMQTARTGGTQKTLATAGGMPRRRPTPIVKR